MLPPCSCFLRLAFAKPVLARMLSIALLYPLAPAPALGRAEEREDREATEEGEQPAPEAIRDQGVEATAPRHNTPLWKN